MKTSLWAVVVVACTVNFVYSKMDPPQHYTNEWVVRLKGGPEVAQLLAVEMGYNYIGQMDGLKDTYRLEKVDHPARTKRDAGHLTKRLSDDDRVVWAQQQAVRERTKRDYITTSHVRKRLDVSDPGLEIPEPDDVSDQGSPLSLTLYDGKIKREGIVAQDLELIDLSDERAEGLQNVVEEHTRDRRQEGIVHDALELVDVFEREHVGLGGIIDSVIEEHKREPRQEGLVHDALEFVDIFDKEPVGLVGVIESLIEDHPREPRDLLGEYLNPGLINPTNTIDYVINSPGVQVGLNGASSFAASVSSSSIINSGIPNIQQLPQPILLPPLNQPISNIGKLNHGDKKSYNEAAAPANLPSDNSLLSGNDDRPSGSDVGAPKNDLSKESTGILPVPDDPADDLTTPLSKEKFKTRRIPLFNDPLWPKQWYMHEHLANLDMNIIPVWSRGYTGRGIRVSILDDGLEHTHFDLRWNYDPLISYDMNDEDPDPTPKYNGENAHGTRCAGEVAMVANNLKCGVGIAYNSKIGGVRMLDGPVTDLLEARSIGYAMDKVDVYSASWGPTDDGETVDGPGLLVREIFETGVVKGRDGFGSIYVWASGNGGAKGDSCALDGYVNSIETVTISSVSEKGKFPWYGEKCAAILSTTYSSGFFNERMVVTTDIKNSCTEKHSGTSASAPMAAGIIALILEARVDLTWRDIQHILVITSRPEPLLRNVGWKTNGVGRWINTRFGYGLIDAKAMLDSAKEWVTVPPASKPCMFEQIALNSTLTPGEKFILSIPVMCERVQYIEHVVVEYTVELQKRGALEMHLTSPMGTREQILPTRPRDLSVAGFKKWKILSVFSWNEDPKGDWTIEFLDTCKECLPGSVGPVVLQIYGTFEAPFYLDKNDGLLPNILSRKTDSGLFNFFERLFRWTL